MNTFSDYALWIDGRNTGITGEFSQREVELINMEYEGDSATREWKPVSNIS